MNQYDWKNYTNNRLELANLSSNQFSVVEVSYENLPDELVKLIKPFYLKYQTIQIPNFNKNLLTELLQLYSLDFTIEQFITIGCSLQNQFDFALDINGDEPLLNEFDLEKTDYKSLFNILERFLFAENHKNLHSILFKFNQTETTKISNFFIVRDLLEAICIGYGITKDNFQERKAEVLENTNQVILSKLSEKVKVDFAQTLYYQIEPKFSKDADVLRFLGTFFHIFQVPTNKRFSIDLYEEISETLKAIDIKNFRHYINGRLKLLHD